MRDGTVTALEDVPVMDCLLLWMNVNIAPLLFRYGFSGSFRCAPEPDAISPASDLSVAHGP